MTSKKPDFDVALGDMLAEDDLDYIDGQLDTTNYFKEAFGSLGGPGKALYRLTWGGIMIFSAGLIFCIWKMFGADNLRDQILFATFAVMLNSAQIALKLWYNMRLNRQAMMREIKRLHLAVARG
ncbi:DUF6768 family protein [Fretibacter rubidus]|uniref:DUF6768 family protein n=1 Tax=Fretibacter rubidus TaxID=570162 RepID=UPI00352AB77E